MISRMKGLRWAIALSTMCGVGTGLARADIASVTVVGVYSNVAVTDAHASGYRIELWREADHYFGFFIAAVGPTAELPAGTLDDLRVDPTTQALTFKAKLSIGRSTMDGEHWVPSRDIYRFEGVLSPDQITGMLIHADALTTDRPAQSETIKLYRAKDEESALAQPATYDQWWTDVAQEVLEAHGPKW